MVPVKNLHFLSLTVTPAVLSNVNIFRTRSICWSGSLEKMALSFEYVNANCNAADDRLTPILHWTGPVSICDPNDIQINQNGPRCDVKAISSRFSSLISTCQYPLLASNVNSTVALPEELIKSSLRGIEYGCRFVKSLGLLESPQIRSVPPFFGAKTMSTAN